MNEFDLERQDCFKDTVESFLPNADLEPCPFCGSANLGFSALDDEGFVIPDEAAGEYGFSEPKDEAEHMAFIHHLLDDDYSDQVMVECDCGAMMHGNDVSDAVRRWNTRAIGEIGITEDEKGAIMRAAAGCVSTGAFIGLAQILSRV